MTNRASYSRRAVLRLLGWIGFGAASLQALRRGARFADFSPGAHPVPQIGILTHGESASAVGAAFLRLRPSEADVPRLLRLLELPDPTLSRLPEAQRAEVLCRLGAQHRDDFCSGRVLKLDGWTLSLTELRLSALAHLAGTFPDPKREA